jgi:hypothetical protein
MPVCTAVQLPDGTTCGTGATCVRGLCTAPLSDGSTCLALEAICDAPASCCSGTCDSLSGQCCTETGPCQWDKDCCSNAATSTTGVQCNAATRQCEVRTCWNTRNGNGIESCDQTLPCCDAHLVCTNTPHLGSICCGVMGAVLNNSTEQGLCCSGNSRDNGDGTSTCL